MILVQTNDCSSMCVGVLESVMSQMLEAFQRSVQQCLADSACAKLAGRSDLGLLMATEPDAELLDDAMNFYVPRSYEGFDGGSFMGALKAAGKEYGLKKMHRDALIQAKGINSKVHSSLFPEIIDGWYLLSIISKWKTRYANGQRDPKCKHKATTSSLGGLKKLVSLWTCAQAWCGSLGRRAG